MGRIDQLLENYRTHLRLPLRPGLPAAQRVWFAVYPAEDERRFTNRIADFEIATKEAGHPWVQVDLGGKIAAWLESVEQEELEEWFRHPEDVDLYAKSEWKEFLVEYFESVVADVGDPERTVYALTGLVELYDFLHVSDLIEGLEKIFKGYLLVFFPGEKEENSYRFLDARKGWNYLATPIVCER